RIQHYKIPIQNHELVSCRRIEAARTAARRYIIEDGPDRVRASRDLTMEGIHVYIVPQPGKSFSSGDHVQAYEICDRPRRTMVSRQPLGIEQSQRSGRSGYAQFGVKNSAWCFCGIKAEGNGSTLRSR